MVEGVKFSGDLAWVNLIFTAFEIFPCGLRDDRAGELLYCHVPKSDTRAAMVEVEPEVIYNFR